IKKEELAHIFERFYTGSSFKEIIGIGLILSIKVMEKQNGELYATSIEEKGTTFFIKFYKNMI
ncbi:MAG: sensor histidine kinase, partial [Bacilli bacterium]|nr:sensor histidine kinase [Bacilli bacterium]